MSAPWTPPPDAADQLAEPANHSDAETAAKQIYDKGARRALEAVKIAIDAGASLNDIRRACDQMLAILDMEEKEE